MASCGQLIDRQLVSKKVKRDVDVKEIYLADSKLDTVSDLARFKNLNRVWLNGNKLRRIHCLWDNFCLSELYLHNNQLVEINGALAHLTCLKVLMLHNNQLQKLDQVIKEFKNMQDLTTLNLFNNPIAQESEYRVYVIHHVPSVQLLDRAEVLKEERDLGRKLYDQTTETIKETVAFGRRSEGPPVLYYPGDMDEPRLTQPATYEVGNNFYRDNPPYESEELAVNARASKRAVMQHSCFDWSKVPRSQERRVAEKSFDSPQIVTVRFR